MEDFRFVLVDDSVFCIKFIVLSSTFLVGRGFTGLGKRKCVDCGADLTDEDVMKIILEDGSFEVFPFSKCPKCFTKELMESARSKKGDDEPET